MRKFLLFFLAVLPLLQLFAQESYHNKIPIPPLLDAAEDTIHIEMRRLQIHQFNPGEPGDTILNGTANQNGIETWCYNNAGDTTMTVLGPVLKWHTGHSTQIKVTNLLPEVTSTHWHGSNMPPHYDGGPHQPIASGETWDLDFTNLEGSSTFWFHPHVHGSTFEQVTRGLTGMIISVDDEDTIKDLLPRTYGIDDIPLIINDQGFIYDDDNQTMAVDIEKVKRPYGLVNGVAYPYVELPAHKVRLRILNASSRKGIQYGISNSLIDSNTANFDDFVLFASDAGYFTSPDTLKSLLSPPGGRSEIIIDLSAYNIGDTLYLRNLNYLMPGHLVGSPADPTGPGGGKDPTLGGALLQIRIKADPANYTPVDEIPAFSNEWPEELQDTTDIDRYRHKRFLRRLGRGFTIDSVPYSMAVINDTVCFDTKEVWTISNETPVSHPFHIHKVAYRILEIDSLGTKIDPKARHLHAPKDDVFILPNWKIRMMAYFGDYHSPIVNHMSYMYHCHILPHAGDDGGGMMHQYVVTTDERCRPLSNLKIEEEEPIQIFPNPAAHNLQITTVEVSDATCEILDIEGKLIKKIQLTGRTNSYTINIEDINAGTYLVRVKSKKARIQKVIVIAH